MKNSLIISLLLFIGLGNWSCEEDEPEDCAGVAGGDNISIDVDTATATYDNPTDADWQYKELGYNLDESTCDTTATDPCGFKATAEINVSALGDSAQVVVLQDDTDAPQDSTETAYSYEDDVVVDYPDSWGHTGSSCDTAANCGENAYSVSLSTSTYKIGAGSLEFGGSYGVNPDFQLLPAGSADFAISLWINFASFGSSSMDLLNSSIARM